jgi:hypothetical protein
MRHPPQIPPIRPPESVLQSPRLFDTEAGWPYIVWKLSASFTPRGFRAKETAMAVGTAPASVFDADLPALSYDAAETPADIYPRIEAAQRQAPIALGPYGPEVLSYRLVRSVLRDTRPASICSSRASRQARCGTRWSTACCAWKAMPTIGCAV